jgi:hypothetical protein
MHPTRASSKLEATSNCVVANSASLPSLAQLQCQGMQHIHVGSTLHVEHVAPLARLDVVLGAEVLEAVPDVVLLRQVIGSAFEKQSQVLVQSLVQDDLGVRDHHHL